MEIELNEYFTVTDFILPNIVDNIDALIKASIRSL